MKIILVTLAHITFFFVPLQPNLYNYTLVIKKIALIS